MKPKLETAETETLARKITDDPVLLDSGRKLSYPLPPSPPCGVLSIAVYVVVYWVYLLVLFHIFVVVVARV